MVALLRGVNVGGRGTLAMADLRRVAEGCGHTDVRTYVQSGNLVFSTTSRSTRTVADGLRDAIAEATDVRPDVVVRTARELHRVIDDNPYADRDPEPTQLHVVFLPGTAKASLPGLDLDAFAPEHATARGQHLYLYLPDGAGRSKLATTLARGAGAEGTMRNWRTVTKLAEMADATP
ncbi:MAG TPA: DUF1697 domain-containing protein [Acidimicrobiales bacterium]|nr:DUF1697 domain-containing protein [Acidimicrobiales bacterium]